MTDSETPPENDPRPDGLVGASSLVLVNTGDGKGKSTAAFGVVMRSVARGWPVLVIQFLKSGDWAVGEEKVAKALGVEWLALGDGFSWDSEDLEADKALAADAWAEAERRIASGQHRLIVLDEVTYPMNWGWIDTNRVVDAISSRPEDVNIVVTGRDAPEAVIAVADTVTEMRQVKHAYESGIRAKRGIDY